MGSAEGTVLGLTGAAFLVKAASRNLPLWARVGYALAGLHIVQAAFSSESTISPIGELPAGMPELDLTPFLNRGDSPDGAPSLTFEARKARTLDERVKFIREQALKGTRDSRIYALARQVLTRKCNGQWCIPEKDAESEVKAMYWVVKARVRYTWDPINYDAFQTPQKTLELMSGDCDDFTSLLAALLMSIGYAVSMRVVQTKGFDTWNHIYLMVHMPDGSERALDPTVNQPPFWEVPSNITIAKKDFPVSVGA